MVPLKHLLGLKQLFVQTPAKFYGKNLINTRRTAIFNYLEGRNASIDAKFSKLPNYHVARKKALQLLKIFLIKDCFDVLLN